MNRGGAGMVIEAEVGVAIEAGVGVAMEVGTGIGAAGGQEPAPGAVGKQILQNHVKN